MVLSRPYLTCSEGKRRGIEWEGMFEVFGVDDVSVLSFNECLLAGSRRGEGEYAVVTCDDNEELVWKEKEAPRVAVTMRYDTQNKYQIEGSHVRGRLIVIHLLLTYCSFRYCCISGCWTYLGCLMVKKLIYFL